MANVPDEDSPFDEKTQKSIERRRAMEKERKDRILNVKVRTMGVDTSALDQQIKEKKDREAAEKAREVAFAREQEEIQRQLTLMELEHEKAKKDVMREQDQFRRDAQKKEETREYDLNKKTMLKEDPPVRTEDGAPVSSLQAFDGEDAKKKEREKQQQEELRIWIEQQKKEKEARTATERELDRLHYLREKEITERTAELERLQEQTRRAMAMATREYNKALADAKAEAEKEDLISRTLQDLDEIEGHRKSEWLAEDPKLAISSTDPNRVIIQQFKGMSATQRRAILEQQKDQQLAKEEERRKEAEQQKRWEQQEISIMRAALLREREIERQRREIAKELLDQNSVAAVDQAQRKAKMQEVFANKVTGDFFDQFGSSSR